MKDERQRKWWGVLTGNGHTLDRLIALADAEIEAALDAASAPARDDERERLAAAWFEGAQAATDWIKSGAWVATMPDNPYRLAAALPEGQEG